jgi:hypothetical protein
MLTFVRSAVIFLIISSPIESLLTSLWSIPTLPSNLDSISSLNMTVISWNLAEKSVTERHMSFLKQFRDSSDIIVVGFQESEDIHFRSGDSSKIKKIRKISQRMVGSNYVPLIQQKFGGIKTIVFAKADIRKLVKEIRTVEVACGVGNILANKGAVGVLLRLKNKKTLALINAHLAAHQTKVFRLLLVLK